MPDDGVVSSSDEETSVAPEQSGAEQSAAPELIADPALLDAVDFARAALFAVTPEATVGPLVGHIVEGEHVLSLLFEATMSGYPGWRWSVTISRLDDEAEPTLLETELMPGEASLLAPDWVPWSERLADYQAAQDAMAADAAGDDESDDDLDDLDDLDEDEDEDDDEDDDDDSGAPVLHSGDIDGVDIDFDDPDLDDDADVDITLDLEAEESLALDADVDESDDAEGDSDEDRPQPPAVSGSPEWSDEDKD